MQTNQLSAAQIAALKTAGLLPNTFGETEAKAAPAPVIVERTASGLTPLYRVRYTSAAGNTETYGVFWEGPCSHNPTEKRLGLKPMLKAGYRMVKANRYSKMSRGFFVAADRCQRVS